MDALVDPQAIEEHANATIQRAGRVDVTFNAISVRGNPHGALLIQIPSENFTVPVMAGLQTHFLTSKASARRMTG